MKAHLVTAEFPLKEGEPITALCEAKIAKLQTCLIWDNLEMGQLPLTKIRCCQKCWAKIFQQPTDRRYVYGCIEAKDQSTQEAIDD
jgi:hypothetical protein